MDADDCEYKASLLLCAVLCYAVPTSASACWLQVREVYERIVQKEVVPV